MGRGKRGGRKASVKPYALGVPLAVALRREQAMALRYNAEHRRAAHRLANQVYAFLCKLGNNSLLSQIERQPQNNVFYENVPSSMLETLRTEERLIAEGFPESLLTCADQALSELCQCTAQLTEIQGILRVRLVLTDSS